MIQDISLSNPIPEPHCDIKVLGPKGKIRKISCLHGQINLLFRISRQHLKSLEELGHAKQQVLSCRVHAWANSAPGTKGVGETSPLLVKALCVVLLVLPHSISVF